MSNQKDGYLIVDKEKALSHLRVRKLLVVKDENKTEEYRNGYIDAINNAIDYLSSCCTIGEIWSEHPGDNSINGSDSSGA